MFFPLHLWPFVTEYIFSLTVVLRFYRIIILLSLTACNSPGKHHVHVPHVLKRPSQITGGTFDQLKGFSELTNITKEDDRLSSKRCGHYCSVQRQAYWYFYNLNRSSQVRQSMLPSKLHSTRAHTSWNSCTSVSNSILLERRQLTCTRSLQGNSRPRKCNSILPPP